MVWCCKTWVALLCIQISIICTVCRDAGLPNRNVDDDSFTKDYLAHRHIAHIRKEVPSSDIATYAPKPDGGKPSIPGGDAGSGVDPGSGVDKAVGDSYQAATGAALGASSKWMGAASAVGAVVDAGVAIGNLVLSFQQLAVQREQNRIQQEQFEREYQLQLTDLCSKICMTEWTPWTACDEPCGGGISTRKRSAGDTGETCKGKPCPGSDVLEQKQDCNFGCLNGGIVMGKGKCTCLKSFAGKCCQNEITCAYKGSPKYGSSHGATYPAKYGSIVEFTCNDGYALVGDKNYQICEITPDGLAGKWSGSQPTCDKVTCLAPDKPIGGRIINDRNKYNYKDLVGFKCDTGYEVYGADTMECLATGEQQGRWSGFSPLCLAVDCGVPAEPLYGYIEGTEFSLGHKVKTLCHKGFRLIGTEVRTCLSNGAWSGHNGTCEAIECEAPWIPDHGDISREKEKYFYGNRVRIECEPGYLLEGKNILQCIADPEGSFLGLGGKWDHEMPECKPTMCTDLEDLENGAKTGNLNYFPHSVSFKCFSGYVMKGLDTIECGENGAWSGPMPTCEACPIGEYKEDASLSGECTSCPSHSTTVAEASSSIKHCQCVEGYWRDATTGQCKEISCPTLTAPDSGSMAECDNTYSNTCTFDCDDGYIMETGSRERTCGENGQWTGSQSVCVACPVNTWKAELRSCLPCPQHSHTSGTGSSRTECVCDKGYEPTEDAQCQDIDECATENGNGPCSDNSECENMEGDYKCRCKISGHIVDPHDKNNCIIDEYCRNLTMADAPKDGGLVCHWYNDQNSQQCSVRCNKGYEFPSRVNNYETCGPDTDFNWTHEEREQPIEDCIEEYFPGYQVEGGTAYFVQACKDLTEEEQDAVKKEFAETLTNDGVCKRKETQICNMEDVGIICGEESRLFTRGLYQDVQEVMFNFTIKSHQVADKVTNCSEICEFLKIPADRCPTLCLPAYRRFLRAAVEYSKQQLEEVFDNPRSVMFQAANRQFVPKKYTLGTSEVETKCQEGMRGQEELCVPCKSGSYFHPATNECQPCPPGYYQPSDQGLTCQSCPIGTMSKHPGSKSCQDCPAGLYGFRCEEVCETCIHGDCKTTTGQCICHGGWEGEACDIDIDGCADYVSGCGLDEMCEDIPAPGTGHICVPRTDVPHIIITRNLL